MKKVLILFSVLALLLSSCKSGGIIEESGSESTNTPDTSAQSESDSTTLGDTSGDGVIEDSSDTPSIMSELTDDMKGGFESVDSVTSADDAVNFIASNVYSLCADALPPITETKILRGEEMKNLTYSSILPDTNAIRNVIISESKLGAFPYSLVMLRCDGEMMGDMSSIDTTAITDSAANCITSVRAITLDNDVVLVMGGAAQVDSVMSAITGAASGVYENVGEVMSLVG